MEFDRFTGYISATNMAKSACKHDNKINSTQENEIISVKSKVPLMIEVNGQIQYNIRILYTGSDFLMPWTPPVK